jgi:hypothetical protein
MRKRNKFKKSRRNPVVANSLSSVGIATGTPHLPVQLDLVETQMTATLIDDGGDGIEPTPGMPPVDSDSTAAGANELKSAAAQPEATTTVLVIPQVPGADEKPSPNLNQGRKVGNKTVTFPILTAGTADTKLHLGRRQVKSRGPKPQHWDRPWSIRNILPSDGTVVFVAGHDARYRVGGYAMSLFGGRATLMGKTAVNDKPVRQILLQEEARAAELHATMRHAAWSPRQTDIEFLEFPLSALLRGLSEGPDAIRWLLNGIGAQAAKTTRPTVIHLPIDADDCGDAKSRQGIIDLILGINRAGLAVVVYWLFNNKSASTPPVGLGDAVFDVQRSGVSPSRGLRVALVHGRFLSPALKSPQIMRQERVDGRRYWIAEDVPAEAPLLTGIPDTAKQTIAKPKAKKAASRPTAAIADTNGSGDSAPRRGPGRPKKVAFDVEARSSAQGAPRIKSAA